MAAAHFCDAPTPPRVSCPRIELLHHVRDPPSITHQPLFWPCGLHCCLRRSRIRPRPRVQRVGHRVKPADTVDGTSYINKDRVYIPRIFPELSTKKITTGEWIDGVRLSDKHGISLLMGDDRASVPSTDPLDTDRLGV
ncbi:hypothetical protein VTO73DRAFT_15600 [Trametes versicolor]